jgi:hypothetical protein
MNMNLAPKPGLKPLPKAPKDDGKHAKHAPEEHDEDAEFEALQQLMDDDDHGDDAADADVDSPAIADDVPVDAVGDAATNGVHSDTSAQEA